MNFRESNIKANPNVTKEDLESMASEFNTTLNKKLAKRRGLKKYEKLKDKFGKNM
jgi:hypothetical protein